MLGKFILFLIAWSLLKRVVKAIRPEQARLGGKGGRGEDAAGEASSEGPARDLIPVDPSDPLAGTVLPGSRPGTCRDCGATYSLPGDFPTSLAQCDACGGIVEVGPLVRLSSELTPSEAEEALLLPGGGGEGEPPAEPAPEPPLPEQVLPEEPDQERPPQPEPVPEPVPEAPPLIAAEPLPAPEPLTEPQVQAPAERAEEPPAGPEPAAPEVLDRATCAPADATLGLLGDRGQTGMAIRDAFAADHEGQALQLLGTVQRVESYGHDAHFGSRKGPRLVLDTEVDGVRAVVLLPEGSTVPERGSRVVAHGRAVGADPYLRALFLAGGSANPA